MADMIENGRDLGGATMREVYQRPEVTDLGAVEDVTMTGVADPGGDAGYS